MDTLIIDRPTLLPSLDELSTPFVRDTKPWLNEWTFADYMRACLDDRTLLDSAARRMFKAIRPPIPLDTANDPRLKRLFGERIINVYPDFADFYGLELIIEQIVRYFSLAADGADARKKILVLVGPPGAAKSALAKRLQTIFARTSMIILTARIEEDAEVRFEPSPFFEHPFSLLERERWRERFMECGLAPHLLSSSGPSPWAWKYLCKYKGLLTNFHVLEVPCSAGRQQGIARIEPRSEKNSDSTIFTGSLKDDGTYDHSGGLNRGTQGFVEIVELFKIKKDILHPLQTAMDEGSYAGDRGVGPIPFRGIIVGHCNRPEWDEFCNEPENKHFLDRLYPIFVPYCMRITEEEQIYLRLLQDGELYGKPRAPATTATLARLTVASRLEVPKGGTLTLAQLKVYDGEDPKDLGTGVKTLDQYRHDAGKHEAWSGISTRDGEKILSGAFTRDPGEVGIDPLLLLEEALAFIEKSREGESNEKKLETLAAWETFVKGTLLPDYLEFLEREIKLAYADALGGVTAQARFENYIGLLKALERNPNYPSPYKGPEGRDEIWPLDSVEKAAADFERTAGITDGPEFREAVMREYLRFTPAKKGEGMLWDKHTKMQPIIERQMAAGGEDMPTVIAFGLQRGGEAEKKHERFVKAMSTRAYSERQIRRLVMWYIKEKNISLFAPDEDKKKK